MKISKLDVAKRELEHSIRLFFLSGDPIIMHLVASAAQTILRDLAREMKIPVVLDQIIERVRVDKRKYVKNKLAEAHNFMKHADKDADKVLEFNPELTDWTMWESVDLYYKLASEVTGLMQAYRAYVYIKHADILEEQEAQKTFTELGLEIDINNRGLFLTLARDLENKRTN